MKTMRCAHLVGAKNPAIAVRRTGGPRGPFTSPGPWLRVTAPRENKKNCRSDRGLQDSR